MRFWPHGAVVKRMRRQRKRPAGSVSVHLVLDSSPDGPQSADELIRLVEQERQDESVPLCGVDDVAVSLRWDHLGRGLEGTVIAENVGQRTCRLGMKPTVVPLDPNGDPLLIECVISLEMQTPSHVVLRTGQRARAPVWWNGWCGDPPSGRFHVRWDGGETTVTADGPRQPECQHGRHEYLTTSWFDVLD